MADQVVHLKNPNGTFKPTHLATKQGRSGMSRRVRTSSFVGYCTGLGNSTYDRNLSWFGDVDQKKDVQVL
jgi:hypothetical protein